ncbi:MAG: CpaF family protein [Lachnospiraceae bacterium]|nr:CpaF family protein [Lachnospiraceae bacterium]
MTDEELYDLIDESICARMKEEYISIAEKLRLRRDIFNSIRRLDILQELVEDENISEIMVNGENQIFIEQNGRVEHWGRCFSSKQKLEEVVQQIAAGANRIINESCPIVDARLADGSRVNIVLPPVALEGPIITIRKFPDEALDMKKLIKLDSLTEEAAEFLRKLVVAGYNIFISGGTGSGKTTFLNALSNDIPKDERIITIEDSAELQIKSIPNLVRLEVRNANAEGRCGISIRDLIKSSLRMRPDRIIVGEVRDEAAIDMLQALNTGHNGMSTGHSNSPADMLSRLETMVLLGTDIPLVAVRKQIASAIDIVVHLGRLRDKSRRVLEICEVLDCVDGEIELNRIYGFIEEGQTPEGRILGRLNGKPESLIRRFKLKRAGLTL